MTRYIAEYIRPNTGTPSPGMNNLLIREYANDTNAMRYMHKHLQAPHFAPGQYRVSTFPKSDYTGRYERVVGYLYKQVPRNLTTVTGR
jgi:hypothetical protein